MSHAPRIHVDLNNRPYPPNTPMQVDHVESRMVICVQGMGEITEKDIKDLLQTKYKVTDIHTDRVIVRGMRTR